MFWAGLYLKLKLNARIENKLCLMFTQYTKDDIWQLNQYTLEGDFSYTWGSLNVSGTKTRTSNSKTVSYGFTSWLWHASWLEMTQHSSQPLCSSSPVWRGEEGEVWLPANRRQLRSLEVSKRWGAALFHRAKEKKLKFNIETRKHGESTAQQWNVCLPVCVSLWTKPGLRASPGKLFYRSLTGKLDCSSRYKETSRYICVV